MSIPSHHPSSEHREYMTRMDDIIETSRWQKKVMDGFTCKDALPPSSSYNRSSARSYQADFEACLKFSDYFHNPNKT